MKYYPASLTGMAGEVSPEYLKRVFFGDPFHQEKGHGFLLGYFKKDNDDFTQGKECIGERMYRGKNQDYYTAEKIYFT